MKVIAINGSPRHDGNTVYALQMMAKSLQAEGIEVEIIQVGDKSIHGCIACGSCANREGNKCVFNDDCVNEVAQKMRDADGFILASPTYYAGIAGAMKCFLDRVFYTSSRYFKYKVATSISVVRRAGAVCVMHQLNDYLHLAQTILPPSQYWTINYGAGKGEVAFDKEGQQTLCKNALGMAWLLKALEVGKKNVPLPQEELRAWTNFVREDLK